MAKYIDLPNLKENLTNFLNKKINPIYAKKTEIPSTVVDDALSLTSTNPVQNKVMKAEFDKVNSNLSDLKVSEVAGWKNLFKEYVNMNGYSISNEKYNGYPVIYRKGSWNGAIANTILKAGKTYVVTLYAKGTGQIALYGSTSFTAPAKTITSDWIRYGWVIYDFTSDTNELRVENVSDSGETYIACMQIEEGTTATEYEPYIPSIKMLADENKKQSTEMMDIKMLGWSVPRECPIQNEVKGNQFVQKVGRADMSKLDWTIYSSTSSTGIFRFSSQSEAEYTKYNIKQGSFAYLRDYNYVGNFTRWSDISYYGNKTIMGVFVGGWDDGFILTNNSYTNSDSFKKAMQGQYLYYELATPITRTIDGNEAVTQIKNDLSDLKDGTTPVAKAVADEDGNNIKSTYATKQDIETTTLTTTSGTATLYKLGKMRHLVLNNATFSSTNVIASTDASVGTLYIRAEILISGGGGDELEGAAASFEDICISGSNMWNATRTATGASPVAVKGATGSATWMAK